MRLALISDSVSGMIARIPALIQKGHQVGLFIPEYYRTGSPAGTFITVFLLPSLPDPFHKNTRIITSFPAHLPSLLSKFRPDIVHFENPQIHLFSPVFYWCKFHKKPLITSVHGHPPSFINKSLYSMSDLIFDPAGKNSYAETLNRLLHP